MHIEHIWVHVLTPLFYGLLVLQAFVYSSFGAGSTSLFASILVMAIAFLATNCGAARPFHVERGAVAIAVFLAYLAVLSSNATPVYHQAGLLETFHVHGGIPTIAVIVAYNVLWIAVVLVAVAGLLRSPHNRVTPVWLAACIGAILLSLLPIEGNALQEAAWLLFVRLNLSFALYLTATLADAAFLTERIYHRMQHRKRHAPTTGHTAGSPTVDVPMVRTLSWLPLSLWPVFVRPVLLVLPLTLVTVLAYAVIERWQLAKRAFLGSKRGERIIMWEHWARPGIARQSASLRPEDCEALTREELVNIATQRQHREPPKPYHRPPRRKHETASKQSPMFRFVPQPARAAATAGSGMGES